MLEQFKTIYDAGEGEVVEKKSRFMAAVRLVECENDAIVFIEEMKKKYWNASHHCYAYVVGERREITRCSDDGEPSGTAGKPMLDVLLGEGLYNTAVVVTRFFGGTLLGTGGLVRAYSKAVQEGLKNSKVITKKYGILMDITTDYIGIGKLQYLFGQRDLPILESEYTETVKLKVLIPKTLEAQMQKEITEVTSGKAVMSVQKEVYYASIDGKWKVWDGGF